MDIIFLRMLMTFSLSFLFGLERQKSHKPIGFGTFIFVSSGACVLGIIAVHLNHENPLPLLSAVVTGIGFLGAGALIKNGDKVFGFTSAALIWTFAILGLCIGLGEYQIALLLYLFIWTVTFVDKYLQLAGIGSYRKSLTIRLNQIIDLAVLEDLIADSKHFKLDALEVDRSENQMVVSYDVATTHARIMELLEVIQQQTWFESYRVE